MKIIVKTEVPSAQITCKDCGSLIEYENRDLQEAYSFNENYCSHNTLSSTIKKEYYFRCPNCGVQVKAPWIIRKKDE